MIHAVTDAGRLLGVKLVHTAVWVLVAGAIVALYPAVALDRLDGFGALHVVIVAETVTLVAFRLKCPLTYVAERYTEDRRPNFDIFLPRWLARWNEEIFSVMLVVAWSYGAIRWLARATPHPARARQRVTRRLALPDPIGQSLDGRGGISRTSRGPRYPVLP